MIIRYSIHAGILLSMAGALMFSCSVKETRQEIISTAKPEDNRFTPVVLTAEGALDEPMMFQVAEDHSVFIIERKGALKKFDPRTKEVKTIATLSVFTENEQGLIGLALDPDFAANHWVYLQYAALPERVFNLLRY